MVVGQSGVFALCTEAGVVMGQSIEDAHLEAALDEALGVVEEMEQEGATSAATAWWGCAQVLRRHLASPAAFPQGSEN